MAQLDVYSDTLIVCPMTRGSMTLASGGSLPGDHPGVRASPFDLRINQRVFGLPISGSAYSVS
jgi:hypothetical protein